MEPTRLRRIAAACAAAAALLPVLAACGVEDQGVDEPAREGLAIDIDGINYNVFITRQLNLAEPPDTAYYEGPAAKPGNALYGVFIQACNISEDEDRTSIPTEDFIVEDNQGNEFEPIELPEDNAFAYHATKLQGEECIPEEGSVAQLGPTAGSMLLYDFPLENTENRPLELVVEGPTETKTFELDL
jgi:hypothetical protein